MLNTSLLILLFVAIAVIYGLAYYKDYKRDPSVLKNMFLIPKFLLLFFILSKINTGIRNVTFKPSHYFLSYNAERIKLNLDTLSSAWTTSDSLKLSGLDYFQKKKTSKMFTFMPSTPNPHYYKKTLEFKEGKLHQENDYFRNGNAEIMHGYQFEDEREFYQFSIDQKVEELSQARMKDSIRFWKSMDY